MPRSDYEIWLAALAKKRAPAEAKAAKLIEAEQYDEAEQIVKAVDDSIYGDVALAKLFKERLKQLAPSGDFWSHKTTAEEVFRRAKHWAWRAYPEPHTQIEADNYVAGRMEDLKELIKILGYRPK